MTSGKYPASPKGAEWDNNGHEKISPYDQNTLQLSCKIISESDNYEDLCKKNNEGSEKRKRKEKKEIEEEEYVRTGLSEKNVTSSRETISSKVKDKEREKEKKRERELELEREERHPKYCYNIEIEESLDRFEGTGDTGGFNSNVLSAAHAALSGRFFQSKEKQAIYPPLRYTIIIHSPITIESLLPNGAIYEILHATTKKRLWR